MSCLGQFWWTILNWNKLLYADRFNELFAVLDSKVLELNTEQVHLSNWEKRVLAYSRRAWISTATGFSVGLNN